MLEYVNNGFEDKRGDNAFIHESSYVDTPCQIGQHTAILHFSHVMAHSIIGNHCHIGHNVTIGSGVMIGNHVRVLNNALLNSGVIIEDNVYCGPSTVFAALKHVRGKNETISSISPTLIKQGASIGPNTTIASGFTIGQFAFIEAGSVIDSNVPAYGLVYGNPLKLAGWRCECGQDLTFSKQKIAECAGCGQFYQQKAACKVVPLKRPVSTSETQFFPLTQSL